MASFPVSRTSWVSIAEEEERVVGRRPGHGVPWWWRHQRVVLQVDQATRGNLITPFRTTRPVPAALPSVYGNEVTVAISLTDGAYGVFNELVGFQRSGYLRVAALALSQSPSVGQWFSTSFYRSRTPLTLNASPTVSVVSGQVPVGSPH